MEIKTFDELIDLLCEESKSGDVLSHHGAGTNIRNGLKLWWSPSWKEPKPPLVEFFNEMNIYHADDMSGTIQAAVEARLNGETFDIKSHIQQYFDHWEKMGYKDGIIKPY